MNGDCDANGVFDVLDFGAMVDRNSNGVADPDETSSSIPR